MTFLNGKIPEDGFLGSTTGSGFRFIPDLPDGKRLSGTVTIPPPRYSPDVEFRLLVDGVPQSSTTINTTTFQDGTHVVAFQVTDTKGLVVNNGSKVVVINNSGTPLTSKYSQAVICDAWGSGSTKSSLAWGRVDVKDNIPFPLDVRLDKIVKVDELNQHETQSEKVWWVDGLHRQPTSLWTCQPILMKNADGDYFVKQYNPQGGGAGNTAANAEPYVRCAPKYDGLRGMGNVSPYSTMNPYFREKLTSGEFGWVGVDKSGRVFTQDITGEIRTLLGPRSKEGVVGTDNDLLDFDIDDRIDAGEMEYVGDDNGQPLKLPHDIWPCSSFPFEGTIADTGNNCVTEVHFTEQRLMRRWPLPGVTSVWDSQEIQMQHNLIWVAVNPEGLWGQRHTMAAPGTNPHLSGGPDGEFTGHVTTLEKLADIPNAFWVRGFKDRIFVFTTDLGIYEYHVPTGELIERLPRRDKDETYVFASIDEGGSIGPAGRIYFGSASQKNGGYGSSKTSMFWLDINTWEQGEFSKQRTINRNVFGYWTAINDPMGHYIWGFAIHPELPICLAYGITSSSPFIWTAYLDEKPVDDPAIPYDGTKQYRYGELDAYLGLASIMGYNTGGMIGYSADLWRDYKTWEDAKTDMLEHYEAIFPEEMSEIDKELVCKQIFVQRTRPRFWDGVVDTPVPDPLPDPDPLPEPDPDPQPTNIEQALALIQQAVDLLKGESNG